MCRQHPCLVFYWRFIIPWLALVASWAIVAWLWHVCVQYGRYLTGR